MTENPDLIVDGLQYCNWSRRIFEDMRAGGVTTVHVTISYWEDFRETVARVVEWNRRFEDFAELIAPVRSADDVRRAQAEGRTGIVFGAQNCSPIEDDIGLVEVVHDLGLRFMQLSYNNQSLLATGCYEAEARAAWARCSSCAPGVSYSSGWTQRGFSGRGPSW